MTGRETVQNARAEPGILRQMSKNPPHVEVLDRLIALLDRNVLSEADETLGQQCARRLMQPLRLIVLGTDVKYAVSMLNLLTGQCLTPPRPDRAKIQVIYNETPFAIAEFRDGTRKSFPPDKTEDLCSGNPVRIRVGTNAPVSQKLSVMVYADSKEDRLCEGVEETLHASDIAIFAGGELTDAVINLWSVLPERLKYHSYLALPTGSPAIAWSEIRNEFVDVLAVDPVRAIAAKAHEQGTDKDAFREAGGSALVRVLKQEISLLYQSAVDGANVLLARFPVEEVKATPASPLRLRPSRMVAQAPGQDVR